MHACMRACACVCVSRKAIAMLMGVLEGGGDDAGGGGGVRRWWPTDADWQERDGEQWAFGQEVSLIDREMLLFFKLEKLK